MNRVVIFLVVCFLMPAFVYAKSSPQIVNLAVTENGFEPSSIDVAPGASVTLNVTRKTDSTCAKKIQIPAKKIKRELPLNKTVSIKLGKLQTGEIRFACGMNMVSGMIHVR